MFKTYTLKCLSFFGMVAFLSEGFSVSSIYEPKKPKCLKNENK